MLPQANGAKLISDDGKKAQLNSAEVVEAIEWAKGHLKRLGTFDAVEEWRKVGVTAGDNQISRHGDGRATTSSGRGRWR